MHIDTLRTSGPALAALLEEAALLRGPFEGFIIGKHQESSESVLHDTAEETTRHTLEAYITTFCCSTGLGSFYNSAGDIEAEEVRSIAEIFQGDLLGWFVHQHGPRRQPSVRERTITAALAVCVPPQRPLLFGLMFSALDTDRATVSFQQQFLQQEPGTVVLRPIELAIENIGSSKRTRDYRPLRPVAGLAPVLSLQQAGLGDDTSSVKQEGATDSIISRVAATGLNLQSEGIERVHLDLLRQMESAANRVASEQTDLRALQYEVYALSASLGV